MFLFLWLLSEMSISSSSLLQYTIVIALCGEDQFSMLTDKNVVVFEGTFIWKPTSIVFL